MDDRFLKALKCEKTDRAPLWVMRQAGRYLPEYRALKEKYSFLELCRNPSLATEVTLLPFKRFKFDAAIMFADILLILETMGCKIAFGQKMGPKVTFDAFKETLIQEPVEKELHYIPKTIKNLKSELKVPLIGFCGAPFTLETYIVEKGSSKTFENTYKMIRHHPQRLHILLETITFQTIEYLKMQIEAGVDALQIFDSWAGQFPSEILSQFAFPYLQKIVKAIKELNVPLILFAKGTTTFYSDYLKMSPQAIGFDFEKDLLQIKDDIPKGVAIQGNLNPDLLFQDLPTIEKETKRLISGFKGRDGFILNLGHGIKPTTPLKAVECLVKTTQELLY